MDFLQIKNAVKDIRFEEVRFDNDLKFEAVLSIAELTCLTARLTPLFGPAIFPSKQKLSKETNRDIEAFGGIMPGQTLYSYSNEKDTIFAMLWPWQDNQRITLKIVKKVIADS